MAATHRFTTRVNPLTGKFETVAAPDSEAQATALETLRREVKDVIAGNVQFHVDTLGPDRKPDPLPSIEWDSSAFVVFHPTPWPNP